MEAKVMEKNKTFVTAKTKQLTDCTDSTKTTCTGDQRSLVAAAIADKAPLKAVKALQKEMKQNETGVWDDALLNALMHQGKKK